MLLVCTLKQLAAVKIATVVFSDPVIRGFENLWGSSEEHWGKYVREKFPKDFPTELQENIVALMRPMSYEVENWMKEHENILDDDVEEFSFYWKGDGTIDRMKTINTLIESKHLPIGFRFVLACNYLLDEDVFCVWNDMPTGIQKKFLNSGVRRYNFGQVTERNTGIWCAWYKNKYEKLLGTKFELGIAPYGWDDLSVQGNLPLKLPLEERFQMLSTILDRCNDSYIHRICYFKMNTDQQMEALKIHPYHVLKSFLIWPGQSLFVQMAKQTWDYLPKWHYSCLLHIMICQKILLNWKDYNYVELLQNFWNESPDDFKEYTKTYDAIFEPLMLVITSGYSAVPVLRKKYLLHQKKNFEKNAVVCYDKTSIIARENVPNNL
ncbi:uncharacterized protein TNCT_480321 [Trichonephila clavata]|uniref:Uncharacterized protein n=1 Tax=Trichonephila clavata TaxID=2740835 RepID=A0A8X6HR97_TRICU|nr:uncharacterized protein TNCT_480321 [Trichonephila clavata]